MNQDDVFHRYVEQLIDAGLAAPETVTGCSEEEIADLQSKLGVNLPASYKQFLRACGVQCGNFLDDCCYLVAVVPTFCREAAQRLANDRGVRLSPTWLVFLERDVMFLFFDTACGDDPPVWRLTEDDNDPTLVWGSFSECVGELVRAEIDGYAATEKG